ncbi:hypothetical protein ABMA28_003504 [Loxostege sticticalis]|uniref:Regulatory protein zeste n=1 Tax=Loxostege sticticalis TaxID=481309 RepID=A0ABD0SWA7_LOXSC
MERRVTRVSEAQWSLILDFLERNPNLARARGYNNSARGRQESTRLWQELANLLNAEGTGTTKVPKDWSTYVSNYKSKLKKIVADINADTRATGGGPPRGSNLSEVDQRFLAILGPGFGQTAPQVSVNPFPDADQQQPSTSTVPRAQDVSPEDVQQEVIIESGEEPMLHMDGRSRSPISVAVEQPVIEAPVNQQQAVDQPVIEARVNQQQASVSQPSLPRRSRQTRHRSRPLAPLDEARRILSQVEMQRAAADAASARALDSIGRALDLVGQNLGRLADAAEQHIAYLRPQ